MIDSTLITKVAELAVAGVRTSVLPIPGQPKHAPCASPAGQPTDLYGQALVPVSRSRRRASGKARSTGGTSGRRCAASSRSAALQRSLASRLAAVLDVNGSPEYELTWSDWAMPSGPPICRLRASARRTSASDCSGWPTPRAEDSEQTGAHRGVPDTLTSATKLAGWPTPMAGTPATDEYNAAGSTDSSRKTVALVAGWTTASATDGTRGGCLTPNMTGSALPQQVATVVGWMTPTTNDAAQAQAQAQAPSRNLSGQVQNLSHAATARPGVLNPEFVRWLQGYPAVWGSCAPTETPSCRRSRRRS